jgi:hypothetical protein
MRLVQMKPILGLFWAKRYRSLEIVSMDVMAGIPATAHTMDHFHRKLSGLLLETFHCCGPDIFIQPEPKNGFHFYKTVPYHSENKFSS